MTKKQKYKDVEKERDDILSKLFNERGSIIMFYRKKHGTDKPCTDIQWSAYLTDISKEQDRIEFLNGEIKKMYKKYSKKLLHYI